MSQKRRPMLSPAAHFRLRDGAIATILILIGLLVLLAISRTEVVRFSQQYELFLITAGVIALSLPGPIVRLWDLPGQLLLWNGLGWGLGLSFLGLPSIGATPLVPMILIAAAITFWPREDDWPVPWAGAGIAIIGGFITCWLLWNNVYPDIPFTDV